jgi:hypothetical protein
MSSVTQCADRESENDTVMVRKIRYMFKWYQDTNIDGYKINVIDGYIINVIDGYIINVIDGYIINVITLYLTLEATN